MSGEAKKCPCCGNALKERVGIVGIDGLTFVHECQTWGCCFLCNDTMVGKIAAAMELAMLRSKYERECDMMGDEEQKELWDEIADANKRVLEVFK